MYEAGARARSQASRGAFLFVNCHSDEWRHVPLGVFGLCDLLERHGCEARIFNAALYQGREPHARLRELLAAQRPRFVGVVVHWKELLLSALETARTIRQMAPGATIVAGGMTAGFLGAELLAFEPIDVVVKGDAEVALPALVAGTELGRIPNLLYRDRARVRRTPCRVAPPRLLDDTCYTRVDFLEDHEAYLRQLDLGFPLFLSRGCPYQCPYCGGSRAAFRAHSGRARPFLRARRAVLRDLRVLRRFADACYVPQEVSRENNMALLRAVAADPELAGHFKWSYGSWSLPPDELIELLPRVSRVDPARRATIEISPETALDADRRRVRDPRLYFGNRDLLRWIEQARPALERHAGVNVFFSRFHRTHTRARLRDELRALHGLREQLHLARLGPFVNLHYLVLSTDTASDYWKRARAARPEQGAASLLLDEIQAWLGRESLPGMGSLCFYHPPGVDGAFRDEYSKVVMADNLLACLAPTAYLVLTRALGVDAYLDLLGRLMRERAHVADPKACYDLETLLGELLGLLAARRPGLWRRHAELFAALARFAVAEALSRRPAAGEDRPAPAATAPADGGARPGGEVCPVLDERRVLVSAHDFVSPDFYRGLEPGLAGLSPSPVLFLFPGPSIGRYRLRWLPVLRRLDGTTPIAALLARVRASAVADPEARHLLDFLERHWEQLVLPHTRVPLARPRTG